MVAPQSRMDEPHQNRRDIQNLRKLSPYIWSYRGRTLLAMTCLIMSKLAVVGVPLVLKEIINALDATDSEVMLLVPVFLVASYGLLRILSSLFNELRDVLFARVRYHAMHQLSHDVLAHLHTLSLRFHLDRRTGEVSRDLERGARSLSSILNYLAFNIIPTAAEFLLVALILFANYNSLYAGVTGITVVVYIVFTLKFSGWRMQFRHTMNRYESRASGRAVDSLLNYESVKYFNNEKLELEAYDNELGKWAAAADKSQMTMSLLNFGQAVIVTLGVTSIVFLATHEVANGIITLGDLVLINALMLQLFVPLSILGIVYRSLQYALADMDLAIKLLEKEPEIQDGSDAVSLKISNPAIEFRNISFRYHDDRPILRNINFTIASGKKVAVVGPSGAGKSTLSRLLFRFYDPETGEILIDGKNIKTVTQRSLRIQLGVVPQDTVLFNESIQYNIAYARPNAGMDEIRSAAKAANLDDFILTLPEGYDTIVGERGLKLSGGEKQRLAIARVILKNPPILVFDEATSSLDTRTEQAILETLSKTANRATTLVIAHRLSTIIDADKIIVLDKGRIVEQGTHAQLIEMSGLYFQLWELQQAET